MADDDRNRTDEHDRWRGGPEREGRTYGQAGGYNQAPGGSVGAFEGPEAGAAQSQQQPPHASQSDDGYTGQTGTGYGRTLGGEQAGEDSSAGEGLLDKAKHAVSGVLGGDDDPESYTRSDDRVLHDVQDRLKDDPFLDATQIEAEVQAGDLTLTGTVTAQRDKQRAQDLAGDVSGVKQVHNNLQVQEADAPNGG